MPFDFSVIVMAALVCCFGVTLQALLTRNITDRTFAVAKWLLWTALAIAMIGFWGPLAILPSVLLAGCAVLALYFSYKRNPFGTWISAFSGVIVALMFVIAELNATNQY